jgi:hypothetical protein
MATAPSWPHLYDPSLEILQISHHAPVQLGAFYLYRANGERHPVLRSRFNHLPVPDIFRFTLYWTLIFYTPLFLVCGTYAFLNLSFSPTSRPAQSSYPMLPSAPSGRSFRRTPARTNKGRSRIASALLVLAIFLVCGFAGAVIGSAVMGFVLAGLYRAGRFNMST